MIAPFKEKNIFKYYCQQIEKLGASKASLIKVDQIVFNPRFRKYCIDNLCGRYEASYVCPPAVGEINELIKQAKSYEWAIVVELIKVYDRDNPGNVAEKAGCTVNSIVRKIKNEINRDGNFTALALGSGHCRLCNPCKIVEKKPCAHPDLAVPSLAAYGIDVTALGESINSECNPEKKEMSFYGIILIKENKFADA